MNSVTPTQTATTTLPEPIPELAQLDPLADYIGWMADHGFKPKTITHRAGIARRLLTEFGSFDIASRDLARWLSPYTGWTRRSYYTAISTLYRWQIDDGHRDSSPLDLLPAPRRPRGRPRPLPRSLAEIVLADATGDLRAWVCLGLYAGLRRHEIAKFRGEHINEWDIIVSGKHDVEATIPTHPELWAIAKNYPRRGYWFPSRVKSVRSTRGHVSADTVGLAVSNHFRECGIEEGAAHRLRHTFISTLSRDGNRTRVVQELARHASLDATMAYDAVEISELRNAVLGLDFTRAA